MRILRIVVRAGIFVGKAVAREEPAWTPDLCVKRRNA